MKSAARMPECPRCHRPLEQVSNSEETWMRCPGCFYDADRSIKPPSSAAQGHEVEGTVPSQWWLDLKVENQRLREALTYYAEGRYPDHGETAREALSDGK